MSPTKTLPRMGRLKIDRGKLDQQLSDQKMTLRSPGILRLLSSALLLAATGCSHHRAVEPEVSDAPAGPYPTSEVSDTTATATATPSATATPATPTTPTDSQLIFKTAGMPMPVMFRTSTTPGRCGGF